MRSDAWQVARGTWLLLLACLFAGSVASASPIIDRILAVVSGSIITLSDVEAAIALRLVNTSGAADPVAAALDQLIERSLMLAEVERYAPPEPHPAQIEAEVRVLRSRAGDGGELDRRLAAAGLTEEGLRAIGRDNLRLDAYLEQRFASVSQASDEELLRYYREHQREFVRDGVQQPLADVENEVRRRLDADRRAALVREWVQQLRDRADVLIVPRQGGR